MEDLSILKGQELEVVKELDDRQLAILTVKLLETDRTLIDIAEELYPDLSISYKKALTGDSKINNVLKMVKSTPFLSGALLSIKLMPMSVLTLHKLMKESKKDNVRATAGKELIRLAESAQRKIFSDDTINRQSDALSTLIE